MTPAPANVEMIKLPCGSNAKPLGWLAPAPKSGMLISASLLNPESYLITEFPPLFAKYTTPLESTVMLAGVTSDPSWRNPVTFPLSGLIRYTRFEIRAVA